MIQRYEDLYRIALTKVGDPDRAAALVSAYMRGEVDGAIARSFTPLPDVMARAQVAQARRLGYRDAATRYDPTDTKGDN